MVLVSGKRDMLFLRSIVSGWPLAFGSRLLNSSSLWPVALGRCAVVIQVAGGPKRATRHQVQVTRVFHRRVVVADGRAENTGLFRTIFVHPNNDEIIGLLAASPLFNGLFAVRNRARGIEDMNVVVVLLVDSGPIAQSPGDRTFLVCEANRDG